MDPRPEGRAATPSEQCPARWQSAVFYAGQADNDMGDLVGRFQYRTVRPNLHLDLSNPRSDCGIDFMWRDGDKTVVAEAKRLRRRFGSEDARAALAVELSAAWFSHRRHDLGESAAEQRLKELPHTRPVYEREMAKRRSWGGGTLVFLHALDHLLLEEGNNPASFDVVVTQAQAAPQGEHVSAESGTAPVLRVVDHLEGLSFRASKSEALNQNVMGARAFFPPPQGSTHAAMRTLEPPGQLVTASPRVTRGPGSPRMEASSPIRGLSITFA